MCDAHGDTVREHAYELLEACKRTLPWIRRWTAANDDEGQGVILALETAIDKAEGRA